MAFVKNAVVKMDWDAEGFYESKKEQSFIAAIHTYTTDYGEVPVIFMNGKACILWDPDYRRPVNRDEFTELLHDLVEDYGTEFSFEELEETAEAYIEVSTGGSVDDDVAAEYMLTPEIEDDIIARIDDLAGYFEIEEEDMA